MDKLKRIIFWGGWYGSRNIGDRLLLISITDLLQNSIGPFHQIVFSNRTDLIKEYFTPKERSKLTLLRTRPQFVRVLQELTRCDLLVFGGGVPFFDQPKQLLRMSLIVFVLIIFHRPYVIWCTSSLQLKSKISKKIIKWVVEGSKNITCRDNYSIKEFKKVGVQSELEIVADPAFALQDAESDNAEYYFNRYIDHSIDNKYFALTPRTLRTRNSESITHYLPKSKDDIQKQLDIYACVLDYLVEKGYTPIFIPMNVHLPDDDRVAAKEIISKANQGEKAYLIDEMIPPRVVPFLYAKCVGSLVSRIHGGVTSALGRCPTIMYAFENKHKGIMESMKLNEFIFDPSIHAFNDIQIMIENLINHRDSICYNLDLSVNKLRESARKPAVYVKSILRF